MNLVAVALLLYSNKFEFANAQNYLRSKRSDPNYFENKLVSKNNYIHDQNQRASSDFDFYVLSMSFQPEFCHMHKHDEFPGCESPDDFWRNSLTLHGLWPEDNDGSWPSTCTKEKFDPQVVSDLGSDRFFRLWPNVKASHHSKSYYSFWEHEWTKHGTCTGMSQDDYFDTVLKHFLPTPSFVGENYGMEVSASDLLSKYRELDKYSDSSEDFGDVILVCSGGKYLSEVRVCVAKNKDGSGSQRIKCIDQVNDESNCANDIVIPKFYVDEVGDATIDLKVG